MKRINNHETPVYREAGFNLRDIETTKAAFANEGSHPHEPDTYIYTRYRNPTVTAVEKQLSALENSQWSVLTQSGMAAIDMALSIFQEGDKTGTWMFFEDIYGGTNSYIDSVLIGRRGINVVRYTSDNDTYDLAKLEAMLVEHKPKLLYFEAVSNPMLIVADTEAIIALAKTYGAKIIIDNTFATPALWKPLDDGADLVIHSATKHLSGHGNITAGVVSGNDPELLKLILEYRKWIGHMLSADDAYRLGTQLKTFELRMERHSENAHKLAKMLENHPKIAKVLYPGLASHPTYEQGQKLFKHFLYGGMLTFDIAGKSNEDKARATDVFIEAVENRIALIPTLGHSETILLPVAAVWGEKYPFPGMIRLSVGIENYSEIEATVLSALSKI